MNDNKIKSKQAKPQKPLPHHAAARHYETVRTTQPYNRSCDHLGELPKMTPESREDYERTRPPHKGVGQSGLLSRIRQEKEQAHERAVH
jgi:hypothetical protein